VIRKLPPSSHCSACGGIFNAQPWALGRSEVCESCGRGRWAERRGMENSWGPVVGQLRGALRLQMDPRLRAVYGSHRCGHCHREIARMWRLCVKCSRGFAEPTYGRRRRRLLPRDGKAPAGKARTWGELGYTSQMLEQELGERGSYQFRDLGSTGEGSGRRARGTRGADLIEARLVQLIGSLSLAITLDDLRAAKRATYDARASVVAAALNGPRPVNAQALADYLGCDRSTIYRLKARGERLMQQKTHKGGEADLSA
jgi:hypothetical protein